MTTYNERLDEILEAVSDYYYFDSQKGMSIEETKQAILRWVANEVIGDTRMLTNYYNKDTGDYDVAGSIDSWNDIFEAGSQQTINEQLETLAQHGYKGDDDDQL